VVTAPHATLVRGTSSCVETDLTGSNRAAAGAQRVTVRYKTGAANAVSLSWYREIGGGAGMQRDRAGRGNCWKLWPFR